MRKKLTIPLFLSVCIFSGAVFAGDKKRRASPTSRHEKETMHP